MRQFNVHGRPIPPCIALGWMCALCAAPVARAQWIENGDAGDFPAGGGYQNTVGAGPLSTISGATSAGAGDLVDAYCIRITSAAAFHATTSVSNDSNASASWDTRLFLFATDGSLVFANDDTPTASVFQSYLSDPSTFPAGGEGGPFDNPVPVQDGQSYILVITGFSNNPRDVANTDIVRINATNGWKRLYGDNPAAGAFHHWVNGSTGTGAYTIALAGAEFCTDSGLGACCQSDAACNDTGDEADCAAAGGTFLGAGTNCAAGTCGGACCHVDGTCTDEPSADACAAAGGSFQGPGVSCAVTLCPQPNDGCDGALPLTPGVSASGSTLAATDDNVPDCTVVSPNQGLWYSVIGTGNTLTATTCQGGTDFDTMLQVWCACDTAICIGGNDDAGGGFDPSCEISSAPGFNRASRVSWCSLLGHEYLVLVGGFNASQAAGSFELLVSDDGVPCGDATSCTLPTGACCTGLTCSEGITEIECAAGGGTYQGDDTLCAGIECQFPCNTCPGDLDGDEVCTGADIQAVADCYISHFGAPPSAACACADLDSDNDIDDADIGDFVAALLGGPVLCAPGRCCYVDGVSAACSITAEITCVSLGGEWTEGVVDCFSEPCPVGRCCSADGLTCADTTEADCTLLGNSWSAGLSCVASPCPLPPVNDDCEGMVTAFEGPNPFDLAQAADGGPGEPTCDFPFGDSQIRQDTWYIYTATCTGTLFIDTCGSDADDTRIAVYDGGNCNNLGPPLECNDDHGNASEGDTGLPCPGALESSLSIPSVAGGEYIIRVGTFTGGQAGPDVLNVTCQP